MASPPSGTMRIGLPTPAFFRRRWTISASASKYSANRIGLVISKSGNIDHPITGSKGIGDTFRAMRVFQPLAVDQKLVAMAALRQRNLGLPDAAAEFEHPDGSLVPVRKIRGQRHRGCRGSANLKDDFFYSIFEALPRLCS